MARAEKRKLNEYPNFNKIKKNKFLLKRVFFLFKKHEVYK